MLNSRDINLLRPDVAANCRKLIKLCKAERWPVLVTGTVRDDEYQLQCYRNGTSKDKTPSFHCVKAGLAFDVCKNVKGQEYSDNTFWDAVGAIGEKIGFTWGGRWKSIVDKPHFQWDDGGRYTADMIRRGKYPPEMKLYEEESELTENQVRALIDEALAGKVYNTVEELPDWGRPTVEKLLDAKALAGTDTGLGLSYDLLRTLVINNRMGLYG